MIMARYSKLFRRIWANISFSKKINIQLPHPIVTFTFDDAPVSAFEKGGNLLAKYGMHGTFYISLSLMNGPDPETRFTVSHLKKSVEQGHELGCHTFGHIDLAATRSPEAATDILHNQETLGALLPGMEFKNFSYPFGSQTSAAKQFAAAHFRSARGIGEGINRGITDSLNLQTVKLYEKKHALRYLTEKIDDLEKNGGWLVFYTHDVDENFTHWGCSPAYFEAVVKECAKRGITVATVNDALDLIENKKV
jgi:peptidoglycan/xylan/chitin deacetylase (PgdA/CDA1 family)